MSNPVNNNKKPLVLQPASKIRYNALIDLLIKSGGAIIVNNSLSLLKKIFSKSPLNLQAVQFLINSNADFYNNDAERALQLLLDRKNFMPASVFMTFMKKLNGCNRDLETMAALLVKLKCPLKYVVYASNERLTQMMLQMPNYEIDNEESVAALQSAITLVDFANLRVLWRSDRLQAVAKQNVLDQMRSSVREKKFWKYRPTFEHLTDWMILDDNFLCCLRTIFSNGNKHDLRVLIQQYNVDVRIREQFKIDVLPMMFRNHELIETEDLIELVYKRLVDVNAKDIEEWTALHYAASHNSPNKIKFLLDMGADCNVRNDVGSTPIFYVYSDIKCVELLLQSGANLHITNSRGYTAFMPWLINRTFDSKITEIMVAQLAIDIYKGVQINEDNLKNLDHHLIHKDYFEECLKQVNQMANYEILPSFTLVNIVTKKLKYIAHEIQSTEILTTIMKWCSDKCLNPYYCTLLKLNLEKAYNMYLTKCRVAAIISKSTTISISFDHLVVDRICDFLLDKDILVFSSI